MSLNDVCYERIKDSFHYGLFGDFKLIIDKNTGYFNATKLCKDGGKRFDNWIRLDKSKELIEYFDKKLSVGILTDANNNKKSHYYVDLQGNEINNIISGTYVYKNILLYIASWISKDFYDKCYDIIENYYITEYEKKYKYDIADRDIKIKEIENKINNLKIDTLGSVYFIKPKNRKNIFKIGYTNDIDRRLESFNCTRTDDEKFELIKSIKTENPRLVESLFHKKYKHLNNELFELTDDEIYKLLEL